ncbi:MAG TPA: hypothetical protein VFX60_01015 [Micromonospora sp.]|nr:hypothetical protein [Micromonospora sp.]
MRPRGANQPDDDAEERQDPPARGRRWGRGRGRSDDAAEEAVSAEEFGWIADLRSAKEQRVDIGPGDDLPGPAEPAFPPRRDQTGVDASRPPMPTDPGPGRSPEVTTEGSGSIAADETSTTGRRSPGGRRAAQAPVPPAGAAGPGPDAAPRRRFGAPPPESVTDPTTGATPVVPRASRAVPPPVIPAPPPVIPPDSPGRGMPPESADLLGRASGRRRARSQPPLTGETPPGSPTGETVTGWSGADDTEGRGRRARPGAERARRAAREEHGTQATGPGGPAVPGMSGGLGAFPPHRPVEAPGEGARGRGGRDGRPTVPGDRPTGAAPVARAAAAAPATPPGSPVTRSPARGAAPPGAPPITSRGAPPASSTSPPGRTVPGGPSPRDAGVASVARAAAAPPAAPPVTGAAAVRPVAPQAETRAGRTRGPIGEGDAAGRDGAPPGDAVRGVRLQLRQQMREQRRLRLAVLITVSLVVLGALPLYFGIRAVGRDPAFSTLDSLAVPGWAATEIDDRVSGSRWCLVDCRLRERTAQSQRPWEETAQAYEQALTAEGWQSWRSEPCPDQPVEGRYSCWRRDELTLDLWVRDRCVRDPEESLLPDESIELDEEESPSDEDCDGSVVSVKVRNAVADKRTRPQPSADPSLIGEEPDPIFTDDPLSTTPS